MSYQALGIWPFDSAPAAPTQDAAAYSCWSDELNEKLAAACQAGQSLCSPQNVAHLLNLDYCEGVCPGSPSSKGQGIINNPLMWLGAGAVTFAVVLALRSKH